MFCARAPSWQDRGASAKHNSMVTLVFHPKFIIVPFTLRSGYITNSSLLILSMLLVKNKWCFHVKRINNISHKCIKILLSRPHHNAISCFMGSCFKKIHFFFFFFWLVVTGSANVGFELKCACDFKDHIFITSEHWEGERARVHCQQRLFRCKNGVLKWDLMSFVQQHEDNGVQGSTRQWLVQYWLYADFCKKARLQESNGQTFTSFLLGFFFFFFYIF